MRIVISSEGGGMKGDVAHHFGRCPEFVLVDAEEKKIMASKVVRNPYFEQHVPFAVPRFLSSFKPAILITGGIGPRAIDMFDSLGIKVVFGVGGKIKNAVSDFLDGKLKVGENICEHY